MNVTEVEERYNKSISALKSLEQILKGLDATYDLHLTRLGWLKHLADSCIDLKRHEVETIRSASIAAQVAQQQAARVAEQPVKQEAVVPQPQPQPVAPVAPVQEESQKKTRKKSEQ